MVNLWEPQLTKQDLEQIIAELKKDLVAREDATQRAISGIRADITDLYSFYKSHKCYVS